MVEGICGLLVTCPPKEQISKEARGKRVWYHVVTFYAGKDGKHLWGDNYNEVFNTLVNKDFGDEILEAGHLRRLWHHRHGLISRAHNDEV